MFENVELIKLWEMYFNVDVAIEAELEEEEEFGNGNEPHLDELYREKAELRSEITKRTHHTCH